MHQHNAPLTVVGSQRAVAQVVNSGHRITHIASESRIARATLSKRVARYCEHDNTGLEGHSSAPANRPSRLPP